MTTPVIEKIVDEQGWTNHSLMELAIEFMEVNGKLVEFENFLKLKQIDENKV